MAQFYRCLKRSNRPCIYGLSILFTNSNKSAFDRPLTDSKYVEEEPEVTGWAGVKKIFEFDEKYGSMTPELIGTINSTIGCTMLGAMIGAAFEARTKYFNFIDHNEASKFLNILDAKRKLQDTVTLGMGEGAWKWGKKIGGFCALFVWTSTLTGAFLGGKGIIENTIAGIITGAVFKCDMGIRGAIAGGLVGGCLGTFYGLIIGCILYTCGVSMREVRQFQFEMRKHREDTARENLNKDKVAKFGPAHADLAKDLSKIEEPKKQE